MNIKEINGENVMADRIITASKTVGDAIDGMVAEKTITASKVATVTKENGERLSLYDKQ